MGGQLPRLTPWPSIYEVIRDHLDMGGRLTPGVVSLPDDDPDAAGMRWAPGAKDGVLGHHAPRGSAPDELARAAAEALVAACDDPREETLRLLHDVFRGDQVLSFVDPMLSFLAERRVDRADLHELGLWLAMTAVDRGAVKTGLAILGVTRLGPDIGVVRLLGAHEEFTLYAAVALTNDLAEPDEELWAMAASVNGWGRIHCVERLRHTADPAIRSWILREGFRTSVGNEYLAYIAATTGGLLEALRSGPIDDELLTAAGEIFEALIGAGGRAETIDHYEDAVDAIEAFLEALAGRTATWFNMLAVLAIRAWLDEADVPSDRRNTLIDRCHDLAEEGAWRARAERGIRSADIVEHSRAELVADALGIDTFEVRVARLREQRTGPGWYQVWLGATDRSRAERLVQLARDRLPLDEIGTGAADSFGLGSAWSPHHALGACLQGVQSHAGLGGDLVLLGLRNPVIRNRNMALHALLQWPREAWPPGAADAVEWVASTDPHASCRDLATSVLGKAP